MYIKVYPACKTTIHAYFTTAESKKDKPLRPADYGRVGGGKMSKGIYLIKPQALIQDKRLTPLEKDYLCLIAQLQKANGCTASNQYFADFFAVKRTSAVEVLTSLKSKGFIESIEKKQGGKTIERTIKIIDVDSRKYLLSDSRELRQGIVGNSVFDSRELPYHTIDNTLDNKYSPNSKELELADFLLSKILNRKPDFKKPNLQSWAKHIDRMIRIDHRKPSAIKDVIRFCQQDDFWQNNILSTEKLRKQFDKLEMKMQKNNTQAEKLPAYLRPIRTEAI